jgi:hypothetical protein
MLTSPKLGYTMLILLVEVIIADITTLRSRLVLSYIPTLPFLLNTWISGNVSEKVLAITTWRWAIGMWAFVIAGTMDTPISPSTLQSCVKLCVNGSQAHRFP